MALSYCKDYYPSPKALPSTLPQGEGYLALKNLLWQQGASAPCSLLPWGASAPCILLPWGASAPWLNNSGMNFITSG